MDHSVGGLTCSGCGMNLAGITGHKCNGYVPQGLNPMIPRQMVEQVAFFDRIFQRLDAIDAKLNKIHEDLNKKRRIF